MSITNLIDEKAAVKDKITVANNELKELKEREAEIDQQLFSELDTQGLSRTANDNFSVSINNDTVPDVDDWDELYAHIVSTQDFSLLQRRVSSTAYKELLSLGQEVPGLKARSLRRINFRRL